MRKAFYLAVSLLTLEALAAPGAVKLQCGAMAGFKSEAEMKLVPSQNLNAVDLTFVGEKPPNKDIDRLLRECAVVAAKRDPSRDALVSAWFRKRPGDNWRDDDLLHPYGAMKFLSYTASSKSIAVRDIKLPKK